MNLRQIELLRAVVRCETTVRAARELSLSQPAVSNAIKHLESQVGFPLFERVNNRLFPTPEARELYNDSDPIFSMHAALEAKVEDLRANRSGHVRIMATPPLGYSVIPVALKNFLAKRPKTRVSFDVRRFEGIIENVDNGVAELGFVMGLSDDHKGVDSECFFSERMVCVMRRDHPFAEKSVITPADLKRTAYIALQRGTQMGTIVRQAFEKAGEAFSFAVEVRYCNTACVLAEAGVGVAIVDPLSPLAAGSDLIVRRFEPEAIVSASAVRSRKRPLSRTAEAFLREVRGVAERTASTFG
ncbi:MAG: LysR family transcriptional regulator [Variibacter sp.]